MVNISVATARETSALTPPLHDVKFTLDTAGVAGVFGGEEAVSAMATVHVYQHRKWLGWYNTPGSYQIAKRYGRLARSRFFDGLFPGVHTDPASLFDLDGFKGPKFRAAHSGTVIDETGHLASLFMKECSSLPGVPLEGRKTQPIGVTIAELGHLTDTRMFSPAQRTYAPPYAIVLSLTNLLMCAACAVFRDWYSLSMILLGIMLTNKSFIGSGEFAFHHTLAHGSNPGDDFLQSHTEVVVLKGPQAVLDIITRGSFSLHIEDEPHYCNIALGSVLFIMQFLARTLLIPQGPVFGPLMIFISLAVSCTYNLWSSSLDKEHIQRDMLMNLLRSPRLTKYMLGTRTSMAVFVLLALAPKDPERIMDMLIADDTKVLRRWKAVVTSRLQQGKPLDSRGLDYDDGSFVEEEMQLLEKLFGDAASAYKSFARYQNHRWG